VVPGASVIPTGAGHGTLAFDATTGELFAALRQGSSVAVEEFDGLTLRPVKRVFGEMRCGERLLAGGGRVVLACLNDGGLLVSEGSGQPFKVGPGTALTAVAMATTGTVLAGSSDGKLFRLGRGLKALETVDTIRDGARLIPDGIAAQSDCCFVVGVLDRVPNPQIRIVVGLTVIMFPEASPPKGGILYQAPFAYYTTGTQARHIDVQQGFAEVMANFGETVLPGAVADR
jgi:hypothetical protein